MPVEQLLALENRQNPTSRSAPEHGRSSAHTAEETSIRLTTAEWKQTVFAA